MEIVISTHRISRRIFKKLARQAAPLSPDFHEVPPGSLLFLKPKKPKEVSPGVYQIEYRFLAKSVRPAEQPSDEWPAYPQADFTLRPECH